MLEGMADWRDLWRVPTASAVVIGPDGVLETFGDLDREYYLASVTKLLTGYAALVGIEEGAYALSDPAGPPGATVRHLLAHASGYGFDAEAGIVAVTGASSTPALSHAAADRLTASWRRIDAILVAISPGARAPRARRPGWDRTPRRAGRTASWR